jgi:hypothetical protein
MNKNLSREEKKQQERGFQVGMTSDFKGLAGANRRRYRYRNRDRKEQKENAKAKAVLDRIVAMPTRLVGRGYSVREEPGGYRAGRDDPDSDTDPDDDANTRPE